MDVPKLFQPPAKPAIRSKPLLVFAACPQVTTLGSSESRILAESSHHRLFSSPISIPALHRLPSDTHSWRLEKRIITRQSVDVQIMSGLLAEEERACRPGGSSKFIGMDRETAHVGEEDSHPLLLKAFASWFLESHGRFLCNFRMCRHPDPRLLSSYHYGCHHKRSK
jgi:hypothetical protein